MSELPTEIVGSVFFDSWLDNSPERRSQTAVEDRHVIYEGLGVILEVLVRPHPDTAAFQLSGQVFPATCNNLESFDRVKNLTVTVEQPERRSSSTQTNSLGEFIFESVPSGAWDLTVAMTDRRFVVRGLSNEKPR